MGCSNSKLNQVKKSDIAVEKKPQSHSSAVIESVMTTAAFPAVDQHDVKPAAVEPQQESEEIPAPVEDSSSFIDCTLEDEGMPTVTTAVVSAEETETCGNVTAIVDDAELDVEVAPAETAKVDDETIVASSSPKKFGERSSTQANTIDTSEPTVDNSFSEYLAAEEDEENSNLPGKRKVCFDAETMRKTAPKTISTNLSKKQREMLRKNHISAGRRGPVNSKWDKGGKSHMQNDVYLEMAAAFERMLTNAETINAHLDTR